MLNVFTAQYKYKGPNRTDVTFKNAEPPWDVFAPTWDMVEKYLNCPDDYHANLYTAKYDALVANAYVANRDDITNLIHSNETRVLVCFCKPGAFCHRVLLARHFESLGATYHGEVDIATTPVVAHQQDPMFKVVIAGGRDYNNLPRMVTAMDKMLQHKPSVTIISGGARGADSLGEQYARLRNYPLIVMKADWDKYGKRAGYLRNEDMAKVADAVVCFWDSKSRGTGHMINLTKSIGTPVHVINY